MIHMVIIIINDPYGDYYYYSCPQRGGIIIIHVPKGAVLLLFMSPKGRYYYYSCPQRGGNYYN